MKPKTYPESKHVEQLAFPGSPPGEAAYFEHDFGTYKLEARILYNKLRDRPWVMSIHGARADYTKSDVFSFSLQEHNISILGINLSGHNEVSPLKLEETTPGTNIGEAEAFYQYLDPKRPKTLVAYSLGATLALKLLERHMGEIDKLVLIGPGIYPTESYSKHYITELPFVLRVPFSYRKNDTIPLLEKFPGKLLLIKGQYDGLDPTEFGKPAGTSAGEVEIEGRQYRSAIPKEVIDMVLQAVPENRRQLIELPGCDHQTNAWARANLQQALKVVSHIADFILQ